MYYVRSQKNVIFFNMPSQDMFIDLREIGRERNMVEKLRMESAAKP